MGYHHQFWVIAQINGHYRTLAVASSWNCGDTDAIHGCWRLLQIFGSEKNRKLLRRELEHAARQKSEWWASTASTTEDNLDEVTDGQGPAFPHVQTCLSLGAAFDSRLKPYPYVYPVSVYPRSVTPMDFLMMNQSGCSIVDISNLQQPQYCFMFYPLESHDPTMKKIAAEKRDYGWANEAHRELAEAEEKEEDEVDRRCEPLRCRPLDPETYLTWPRLEKNIFKPYVDMSPWDIIPVDTLYDLWPQIPWPSKQGSSSLAEGQTQAYQQQHERSQGVNLPDDVLLQRIFTRETGDLDFSPFPWLPEATISRLLDTLASSNGDVKQAVARVDLSGNRSIGPALVARLLSLYPNIAVLTALHTSPRNLPLRSLLEVLAGREKMELHHSELFSAAYTEGAASGDDAPYEGPLSSLPSYYPAVGTVEQVVFLSIIMQDGTPKPSEWEEHTGLPDPDPGALRLPGGGLRWSHLCPGDMYGFGKRDSPFAHVNIPLRDAFLDPQRLADWLPRLLWFFATNSATNDYRSLRGGHASLGCALALAMETEDDWRVSPIPATAFIRGTSADRTMPPMDMTAPVPGPGGWTLLVVSEDGPKSSWYKRRCDALRYAFVTNMADQDNTDRLTVCGPADFYTHTMGNRRLDAGSKDCAEGLVPDSIKDLVKLCEFDEVQEIVGPFMQKRTQLLETPYGRRARGAQAVARHVLGVSPEAVDKMAVLNAKQNSQT